MAITLPTPLRVAAGIVASGIELVRSLPEELPALPVTLVGKAMQLSMKVQQEIAELATKGDELLGGVLGGPQENPPWAHFDDEPPAKPVVSGSGPQKTAGAVQGGSGSDRGGAPRAGTPARTSGTTARTAGTAPRVAEGGKAPVVTPLARSARADQDDQRKRDKDHKGEQAGASADVTDVTDVADVTANDVTAQGTELAESEVDSPTTDTSGDDQPPDATGPAPTAPGGTETAAESDADARVALALDPDVPAGPVGESANGWATTQTPAPPAQPADEPDEISETSDTSDTDDAPAALPDYDRMTLAQVRGYLRSLSAAEVQSLLDHEQSGENRAPFLTLLSNRLVTLEHQES